MTRQPGLRERKKRETRQRIADVASMQFILRGFDNVTVAEIAEQANVSKVTVFNYFPRKEDMLFDRQPEAVELFTGAIRDRPAGQSAAAALHAMLTRLATQHHPLSGLRDGIEPFLRTVRDSPTLRAALRENSETLQDAVAETIAEQVGAAPNDPRPALIAATMGQAYRSAVRLAVEHILAGAPAADAETDYLAILDTALDLVEHGLPGYGSADRPARSAGE